MLPKQVCHADMSYATYEPETAQRVLEHAINWSALQEHENVLRTLESQLVSCSGSPRPSDEADGDTGQEAWQARALQRLKQYLVQSVPTEWTVQRVRLDPAKAPAAVNARGVCAGAGVLLFGGMTQGEVKQMEVEHETSWMKKVDHSTGLVPDTSQVYRVRLLIKKPCSAKCWQQCI